MWTQIRIFFWAHYGLCCSSGFLPTTLLLTLTGECQLMSAGDTSAGPVWSLCLGAAGVS